MTSEEGLRMTSDEASSMSVGVLGGEVSEGEEAGGVMVIIDLGDDAGESQTLMRGELALVSSVLII